MEITIIHGCENHLFSISSVQALMDKIADKSTLVEIKNAGFSAMQSHPAEVVGILRGIVDKHSSKKSSATEKKLHLLS